MGKAFGLIMMLGAMYLGMQIYAEGMENVLGGILAPIQSSEREPLATGLTPAAQLADEPASPTGHRVRITDAVRQRVSADLAEGARRYMPADE